MGEMGFGRAAEKTLSILPVVREQILVVFFHVLPPLLLPVSKLFLEL